ncbi:SLBB domain-containing protein [Synechococcus sp. CS-1327]|uniref:SLBB domain-containing protein n=1 Tax=Synechococcus sp. CS-1327 TaxID=2847977 RepID=UPI00223A885D|nr:SLBB domain-containing protein [Synechococcus sp. CS-1327]
MSVLHQPFLQPSASAQAVPANKSGISRAADAPTAADAYLLGPGDQLLLEIFDPVAKDLGGTVEILNDGSASLALLGSVILEGLTVNQASLWLSRLYSRYLLRSDLNLRVVRPRPIQVSVVGEVQSPGLYSLTTTEVSQTTGGPATTISGLPTVVTAIQKAGGLTLSANLDDVLLRRRLPGASGQLKEIDLDLLALLRQGDKRQNPFLFDGDTLIIGKAPSLDRDVMELAAANLSPQQIKVNVIGEVVTPGSLDVKANTPLVQAILAAGGPKTFRAKHSNVELVRINRNGTATRELFQLDYNQGVSGPRNPPLRDGDTVIVNRSAYAVATDALGAVTTPLSGLVNSFAFIDIFNNNRN